MEAILKFFENYEIWFYVLGGIVGLFYLQRLIISWRDWRTALFGLERESAQRRFSSSMTGLILIALFLMAVFILISFVSPSMPQTAHLPTATLNPLATATATLEAVGDGTSQPVAATVIPVAQVGKVSASQCVPGQIEWTDPTAGMQIGGTVVLQGTVNVPNFGFYKYEFSQPPGDNWSTIAAGNKTVINGEIGKWNTVQLTPGDYLLRLVVVDNQNQTLPACVIQVRVIAPTEVP